jgi:hypothetical protein
MAPIYFGETTSCTSALGLLDSVRPRLRKLTSVDRHTLILEVAIIAASFVSEGSVTVRIRSATGSGRAAT